MAAAAAAAVLMAVVAMAAAAAAAAAMAAVERFRIQSEFAAMQFERIQWQLDPQLELHCAIAS